MFTINGVIYKFVQIYKKINVPFCFVVNDFSLSLFINSADSDKQSYLHIQRLGKTEINLILSDANLNNYSLNKLINKKLTTYL